MPSGRYGLVGLKLVTTNDRLGSTRGRESFEIKESSHVVLPCKISSARTARSSLEAGLIKKAIQKRLEVKTDLGNNMQKHESLALSFMV